MPDWCSEAKFVEAASVKARGAGLPERYTPAPRGSRWAVVCGACSAEIYLSAAPYPQSKAEKARVNRHTASCLG